MVNRQIVSVFLVLSTPALALAERAPEAKDSATHVVTALVTDRFGKDRSLGFLSETYTDFVVVLKVQKVERGDGVHAGQVLHVHCFQRTRNAPLPLPGMAGHNHVPKPGQRIRAYLNERAGVYEFVYPDGLAWLDGGPMGRVVESPVGASAWGYVLAFILGAASAALILLWRGRRTRRVRHTAPTGPGVS